MTTGESTQGRYHTELFRHELSDGVRETLQNWVEQQWEESMRGAKASSNINHSTYEKKRDELVRSLAIAIISGYEFQSEIQDMFHDLQQTYATAVRKTVNGSRKDHEDTRKTAEQEISGLADIEKEFGEASQKVGKQMGNGGLQSKLIRRMSELTRKLEPLTRYREERDAAQRVVEGIDHVTIDLDTLLNFDRDTIIHYRIHSPEEILKKLANGSFEGAYTFDEFRCGQNPTHDTTRRSSDIFVGKLPPLFEEALALKHYIEQYRRGAQSFKSGDVKGDLDDHPWGAKMIGSYLKDHGNLFGVELVGTKGGRHFRSTGARRPDSQFVEQLWNDLPNMKRGPVNKWYIDETIADLEQQGNFEPMTVDEFYAHAQELNFPITRKMLGKNFGSRTISKYNIERLEDDRLQIKTVNISEERREDIAYAVEQLGFDDITEESLNETLRAGGRAIVGPRFYREALLACATDLELQQTSDSPITYRCDGEPKTASEMLEEHEGLPTADELA